MIDQNKRGAGKKKRGETDRSKRSARFRGEKGRISFYAGSGERNSDEGRNRGEKKKDTSELTFIYSVTGESRERKKEGLLACLWTKGAQNAEVRQKGKKKKGKLVKLLPPPLGREKKKGIAVGSVGNLSATKKGQG